MRSVHFNCSKATNATTKNLTIVYQNVLRILNLIFIFFAIFNAFLAHNNDTTAAVMTNANVSTIYG